MLRSSVFRVVDCCTRKAWWVIVLAVALAVASTAYTARYFAISSREEAAAYLAHPTLGPRLRECCRLTTLVEGRSAREIEKGKSQQVMPC